MDNIVEHLRKLGRGEVELVDWEFGICKELSAMFHYEIPKKYFEAWGKYSGDKIFPVPHETLEPSEAFDLPDLWADDQYGNDRRELCLHLAECIENDNN